MSNTSAMIVDGLRAWGGDGVLGLPGEQPVTMTKALAKGQPNGARIASTLFRDKIEHLTRPREP